MMDATNLSFLLPPSVAHKRNELEKRASHHSGQFGQQPLFPRHGGREEGRREDRCCWSRRAAVREERTTRSGLDGKDSRWVGRLFEGPQRNKRGREKRLARPRNNCDIMIQIPFDVLTRRTTHAGGRRPRWTTHAAICGTSAEHLTPESISSSSQRARRPKLLEPVRPTFRGSIIT